MIVPDDNLLGRLWLVSASDDNCCYLVDDRVATAALARLRPKAAIVGRSAIRILSEFFVSAVPFGDTHSSHAVAENRCIDVDLSKSKYARDNALLAMSEIAFYGSPRISILPIVRAGRAYLFAVFPTADRSVFEPVLSHHLDDLIGEFDRMRGALVSLRRVLKESRSGLLSASAGEFAGGLLTGIVKSMGGP